MKTCAKCRQDKPYSEFYKHPSTNDGLGSWCKSCAYEYNKQRPRNYQEEYRKRDRNKLRASWRKTEKRRIHNDVCYALSHRMRTLIYQVLRGKKRNKSWKELVGYAPDDLRLHLESKFADGMTWKKFRNGKIHIDHIIPIDFFQYSSPEEVEFKMCWRLENLQPLWAKDNRIKSNKLSPTG